LKKLASFIIIIIFLFAGYRFAVGAETNKAILNLPAFELKYYEGETLVKVYPVAIGRKTSQTPIGDFKVINKLTFPTWFPRGRDPIPPGPANPLGTRWLGFKNGYGIHGSNKPSVIGTMASAGCVRLYNKDVEELYEKVVVGTPIKVIYETLELSEEDKKPYVKVHPDIYGFGVNTGKNIIAKLKKYNILISEEKLSLLLNDVNKKPVIFNQGYFMTFNDAFVTNDIEIVEQEFYINKQEIEDFFGAVTCCSLPVFIQDKEYISIKEIIEVERTAVEVMENEEIINTRGNLLTVNGTILKAECLIQYNDTLIPIRPLAEFLGWNVSWDSETWTVYLNEEPLKTTLVNSRSYMSIEEACSVLNLNWAKDDKKWIIKLFSR
jgi:hypothetical protein